MSGQRGGPESSGKPVKLRESCDSCLAAKVKCSKSRPLCNRCLINGAPCDYSPSSRSGKRNRNIASKTSKQLQEQSKSRASQSNRPVVQDEGVTSRLMYSMFSGADSNFPDNHPGPVANNAATLVLEQNPGIDLPPYTDGGGLVPDGESVESTDFLPTPSYSPGDFLDPFSFCGGSHAISLPGLTDNVFCPDRAIESLTADTGAFKDTPYFRLPNFHSPLDMMPVATQQTPPKLAPHFIHQSHSSPPLDTHVLQETEKKPGACDCFAASLHVLQSLHHHSTILSANYQSRPRFDVVLKITREAIDCSSHMLGCADCLFQSGRGDSTMMLATIFSKALSLYQAACHFQFRSTSSTENNQSSAQLAFGAYTVTGENRKLLEVEILLLELRKFEQALQLFGERFQNTQRVEKDDEAGMHGTLVSYLKKNLQGIVESLLQQKGASQQAK